MLYAVFKWGSYRGEQGLKYSRFDGANDELFILVFQKLRSWEPNIKELTWSWNGHIRKKKQSIVRAVTNVGQLTSWGLLWRRVKTLDDFVTTVWKLRREIPRRSVIFAQSPARLGCSYVNINYINGYRTVIRSRLWLHKGEPGSDQCRSYGGRSHSRVHTNQVQCLRTPLANFVCADDMSDEFYFSWEIG